MNTLKMRMGKPHGPGALLPALATLTRKIAVTVVLALTTAIAHAQYSGNNQIILIDGVASNWVGTSHIGNWHWGNVLVVTNGGTLVATGDTYMGINTADSNNAALVTGTGSAWTNSGRLRVGVGSAGNQLTIIAGGMVRNTEGTIGYGTAAGNNTVLVTGAGSVWSNSSFLCVGGSGAGNLLTITNGGKVHSADGSIGSGGGANGNMALVAGAGSVWSNSADLMVGNYGSGNLLTIAGGGKVHSAVSRLGNYAGANSNTVFVSGSGSVWTTTGDLTVNNGGTGNGLILSNGGVVAVSGTVTIKAGGYVTNVVTGMAGGLDMAGTTLALNGRMAIVFATAPTSTGSLWGLRWAGSHVAVLRRYTNSGALTIADTALPAEWRNRASIYWDGTHTYIGFNTATNIVVTLEQFGAAGNGVHDDTDAFSAAAGRIYTNGSGTLVLSQGKTYRVGRQYHVAGQYPYYQAAPMFSLRNPDCHEGLKVVIEGNGATVKLNDGLRIGAFYKDTGEVYNPTNLPFNNGNYAAQPGTIFSFDGCSSVEIRNLTIDGNVARLIPGGIYGDTGYQCEASGLSLKNCDRIRVDNVTSSHCGLDGIVLGYYWLTEQSPAQDWVISNSRFEYNARQGMSWIGGKGLIATNCKFNHTGRESFFTKPYSGLDIEAENSVIRNGLFVSCDFVNNTACGMVADTGDSADVTFTNCLFWGTSTWPIWPRKPGFRFYNCRIYGTALKNHGSPDPELANQFHNCHFEDYDGPYEGKIYSSYRYGYLICFNFGGENVVLDGCTLVANKSKALCLNSGARKIVKNCDIYHNWADAADGTALSIFANAYVENTRFHEKLGNNGKKFYIAINTNNVSIGPGVYIDGPQSTWGWTNGQTGIVSAPIVR